MEIIYKEGDVPKSLAFKAWWQSIYLSILRLVFQILGVFVIQPILIMFFIREQHQNQFGLLSGHTHSPEYVTLGSSGIWLYCNVPAHWKDGNLLQKFLWLYGNDKDGYWSDKRGEYSVKYKGQERHPIIAYLWSAWRNPVNNLRFSGKWFSVIPAMCDRVTIYGYDHSVDNKPVDTGWWFIVAECGGRKYYSYRAVLPHNLDTPDLEDNWFHNASVGFKLKPDHFEKDVNGDYVGIEPKGFTSRISKI